MSLWLPRLKLPKMLYKITKKREFTRTTISLLKMVKSKEVLRFLLLTMVLKKLKKIMMTFLIFHLRSSTMKGLTMMNSSIGHALRYC